MTATEIATLRPISEVWQALGGDAPVRGRAKAFFRDGDNPQTISLSDEKMCFFDHRDNAGGGVLDLIQHVRGGSRADSLHWLADLNGVTLENRPATAAERREFARRRARAQKEGADLVDWKQAMLAALKRERARWWDAYHGSLRYILDNGLGLEAPLGDAMATLHEIAEEKIELLHVKIDRLAAAPFASLVPMFRALKGVTA
jgi:hypothetical protein